MADSTTLIEVSAFSGLAGALLTQIVTVVNNFLGDKRKLLADVANQWRSKKVEIAESFFYITGEKMTSIKKNIGYWKNWHSARTEASLDFLYKETSRFNAYIEKVNAENWKFNLITLYFDISFTNEEVVASNARSHQLYLSYLDLTARIRKAEESEKEKLYQQYALVVFDMCTHYEEIYKRLEDDMTTVKTQLLEEFAELR
ncbi:MAG: hypothetical protein JWQ84_1809 [Mucilaginibacter sp.]|nr:hypothetical protein [Mucilaginibacter sp.]